MARVYAKSGHAPGHVRGAFLDAVEKIADWDGVGSEPVVEFEVNFEVCQITVGQACHLVSRCTDALPSDVCRLLEEFGMRNGTYAAGAKALLRLRAKSRLQRVA